MSSTRVTLAQQLAELQKPAPTDNDPEDEGILAYKPRSASEQRVAAQSETGREHYLDVGPSSLRKLADSISDPKYDGVKVSRKQMMESDESEHDQEHDEDEIDSLPHHENVPELQEMVHPDSAEELSESEHELHTPPATSKSVNNSASTRSPQKSPSPPPNSRTDELASTLKRTREEERKKGRAVTRQLAMYDCLMDARIRLQKCVSPMNTLPDSTGIPSYLMTHEARLASERLLQEALAFSDELFNLREKLLILNESLTPPPSKRRKTSGEDGAEDGPDRDLEEELDDHMRHATSIETVFHPYLLTTLQKWSNKVLAVAPSALLPSNHTKFTRSAANQVKSAIQLVDETLLERDRLVSRTRVFRGKRSRLGLGTKTDRIVENDSRNEDERDEEDDTHEDGLDIFDDTDFYQQLLRDVIDSRSGSAAGTGLDGITEDWRAAQKQRKAKKVVDTRASKGRKLRYEVHEKLQNFMAPIPAPAGAAITWHEEQIDELFASLLGKGFEDAPVHDVTNGVHEIRVGGEDREGMDVDAKALQGFRVFG